jgi:hypothetical protein
MTIPLFVLSSPEDAALATELGRFLAPLRSRGQITVHRSDSLSVEEQVAQVRAAGLMLVLLTPAFIDSPLWRGAALEAAAEERASRGLRVVPLLMEPCDLKGSAFEAIVLLPRLGALSQSRDRMSAWIEVTQELRMLVESLDRG